MSNNEDISKGAVGWITFAGFMMVIGGGFAMLEGLGMLIHKENFPGVDAVLQQHSSTWGWFHIIVGAVLFFAGFAIFSGNALARTVGVIAAAVSALGAFTTIQLQPVWNTIIIAVDIAIIWALTTRGRDVQKLNDLDA
jgi:hypothetical protein